MKLRINRQELAEATTLVSNVAAARTPKPILQCGLLRAGADHVELEATDLEIGLRCMVGQVEVEEQGEVLVAAEKLAAIVRESADELLDMETDATHCHVRGADSHFQINMQDTAEFPKVATMAGDPDFEIAGDVLRRLAERTGFAAARENTRYAINGVLWERQGARLTLVATDGRRLSQAVGQVSSGKEGELQVIVPSKAMNLIRQLFGGDDEVVGVQVVGNQILLRSRRALLSTALVEGHFPKHQDVIPTDNDKQVQVNVPEMLSAVRRAALLTNEESRGVRFAFSASELALSSRAPQQGEARVTMPVRYDGEPLEIGFNPNFLIDVLRVVHEDEVTFELKEPNRPGVLRCGDDFLYVVMPVNLS